MKYSDADRQRTKWHAPKTKQPPKDWILRRICYVGVSFREIFEIGVFANEKNVSQVKNSTLLEATKRFLEVLVSVGLICLQNWLLTL
jgi:hypothetical protein